MRFHDSTFVVVNVLFEVQGSQVGRQLLHLQ